MTSVTSDAAALQPGATRRAPASRWYFANPLWPSLEEIPGSTSPDGAPKPIQYVIWTAGSLRTGATLNHGPKHNDK